VRDAPGHFFFMSNVRGKIFCQRCKSPNELGEDLCGQCGTRLMLMVEPSGARFETRGPGGGMEEHLLERITAIENNISRVIDKLEKMAELMLKQSRSAYFDHELLDTLITVLGEANVIDRRRLAELWRERRKKEPREEDAPRSHFEDTIQAVLGGYGGGEPAEFERLVREGFAEIEKGRINAGLRGLERAAALAPDDGPLNHFLGVQLYRKGKTAPARDYFERALAADPESGPLRLLLGLACGDEGEAERARVLLKESVRLFGSTYAAHYALGRLAASESDWKVALNEFRLAQAARPGPESHYLVGLANFRLGRARVALRESKKAVGLDANYGAALYLLGIVRLSLGEREEARSAFESAAAAEPGVPLYAEARENPEGAPAPTPFEPKGRDRRRRLISCGDERLAAVLREDALAAAAG
jgi:tetratricopeptide (TPR) repeat protein